MKKAGFISRLFLYNHHFRFILGSSLCFYQVYYIIFFRTLVIPLLIYFPFVITLYRELRGK